MNEAAARAKISSDTTKDELERIAIELATIIRDLKEAKQKIGELERALGRALRVYGSYDLTSLESSDRIDI